MPLQPTPSEETTEPVVAVLCAVLGLDNSFSLVSDSCLLLRPSGTCLDQMVVELESCSPLWKVSLHGWHSFLCLLQNMPERARGGNLLTQGLRTGTDVKFLGAFWFSDTQ